MTGKTPSAPPERHMTARRALLEALDHTMQCARELSVRAGLSEKDVYQHLEHLQRSHKQIVMQPAHCLACHFRFEKRQRLNKPGRCPLCRSTRIEPPRFAIED